MNIGRDERTDIVVVYNNMGIRRVLHDLSKIAEEYRDKRARLIVVGDFNAKIGEEQIVGNEEEEGYRKSEYGTLNAEGKLLMAFCEDLNCKIENGATKGDWEGKASYIGGEDTQYLTWC